MRRQKRRGDNHSNKEESFKKQWITRYLQSFTDASGVLRPDLWRKGIEDFQRMKIVAGVHRREIETLRKPRHHGPGGHGAPGAGGLVGVQWVQIGPSPLIIDAEQVYQGTGPDSGQVADLAIDPTGATDQILYLAANDGGIWKSTDGGATWAPKTNALSAQSMGAVALDPSTPTTIYAGTGNLFGYYLKGVGIYKSTDAGETWAQLGASLFNGVGINRIVMPASGSLLVATNAGLYKSIDGGLNFGSNAPSFNNNAPVLTGYITGLALDTASSTTVLAAVNGRGLYKSTDGGATFPTNLFANPGGLAIGTFSFLAFAQSTQPDNQTIYAYPAASPHRGLFKSTDGGAHWNELVAGKTAADSDGGAQLGYDQTIGVDPRDASRVYLGFQELWLLASGGTVAPTSVSASKIHWDHHALVFSPSSHWSGAQTRFYCGTDGGLSTSANGGTTFTNLNAGIATNLIFGMDIGRGSTDNNAYSFAGCQDTGTVERQPTFSGTDWHLGIDGDGGPVAVDPRNPQRVYGSDDGGYVVTSDAGAHWSSVGGSGLPSAYKLAVDRNNNSIVYALAGTQLYQSTDTGAHYTSIHTFAASPTAIGLAELDGNTVWIGLSDGTIASTHSALSGAASTWTVFSTGLPSRPVDDLAVDPANEGRVVAAYSGVSGIAPNNRTQHVYMTTDAGAHWNDISGTDGGAATSNLPDLPYHGVVIDSDPLIGMFGIGSSPSLIVAVGLFGNVLTSPDGVAWSAQISGTSATLADVIWTGSQFVAVGLQGTILTSPDGSNWTARSSGSTIDALQGVAWSGSRYVVTSASFPSVFVSTDSVSWTQVATGATQALGDVVWTGSQFVAVGWGGTIVTSPDGLIWTTRSSGTTQLLINVATSGSTIVAAGVNGTLLTSPNGLTWTTRTIGTADEIDGVAWSGSVFVAVINSGAVFTSPDGATWTARTSGTSNRLIDVTWSGSQFVAAGDFGTIITSPNGVDWTDRSFATQPHSIIVCNDAGVLQTTDLGATWHVLGIGLPAVKCTSLALDWAVNPSLIRVSTYGRSAFELETSAGARLAMVVNAAFGRHAVGTTSSLTARLFNVGSTPLHVIDIARTSGSADFSTTGLALPATLPPGTEADVTIRFQPSAGGDKSAVFTVTSDDFLAPTQLLPASGTGF